MEKVTTAHILNSTRKTKRPAWWHAGLNAVKRFEAFWLLDLGSNQGPTD